MALTDANGAVVERVKYDPYGQPTCTRTSDSDVTTASHFANPWLFQGQRFCSETGMYYFKNRDQKPDLGRFLQRDPIGYVDGLNLYQVVQSRPIAGLDPYGELEVGDGGSPMPSAGYDPDDPRGIGQIYSKYHVTDWGAGSSWSQGRNTVRISGSIIGGTTCKDNLQAYIFITDTRIERRWWAAFFGDPTVYSSQVIVSIPYEIISDDVKKTCEIKLGTPTHEGVVSKVGALDVSVSSDAKYDEKATCCCKGNVYLQITYTNKRSFTGGGSISVSVKKDPVTVTGGLSSSTTDSGGEASSVWRYSLLHGK